jgi:DNA-binding response OmpR family regulator
MRLLVVEDYGPLRRSLVRGLTEAGFAVDAASDGEEALRLIRGASHDVIVLDLMLPKRDGLSVLRDMRSSGHPARVLVLTAMDAVSDRVRGLNIGADDYLVKPFAFEELLARVRVLVRRNYRDPGPVITVGDLVVDTTARRISRSGKDIDLTAREFAIMEILALRAGQIVTRTEIAERIYSDSAEPSSNAIDVYVGYLRRKLEAGGGSRLLHTRRGIGYVLEALP